MFERFGEFDSWEELNQAAEARLKEGDDEALLALAEENGIEREDVEDYMDGIVPDLTNPLMAAYGKLDVESRDLKLYGIMEDWLRYIRIRCAEDQDVALLVRKKGKSLRGCVAHILVWSFKNARDVDKDILKAAGIKSPRVTLGIPDMAKAKELITEYYMGGKS